MMILVKCTTKPTKLTIRLHTQLLIITSLCSYAYQLCIHAGSMHSENYPGVDAEECGTAPPARSAVVQSLMCWHKLL